MSWAMLGELCRPRQWPILGSKDFIEDGPVPVWGANGIIGQTSKNTHDAPVLLIGCRGTCGSVHITSAKSYANGNAMALDDLDETRCDLRYLAHYLSARGFQDVISGSSQPQITRQNIVRIKVPLPPLDKQRRIAAILDKAHELRTKRRQALVHLDVLNRSIFRDMFDSAGNQEAVAVPIATFGEVLNFRTGKLDSNAAEPNGKYPFFTCAKDISSINEFAFDQEALLLAGNNASGTYDVKRYRGKFNAYQRTYVIDIDRERLAFAYVHAVLEDRLEQMKRSSRGTGTKYLTLSILRPMSIPIPPLRLQNEFEKRVSATDRLKDQYRVQLAQLDALFASLQQRVFAGELG